VKRACLILLGALVSTALLTVVGCGGSDDGSASSDTTSTSSSTSTAGPARLSSSEWTAYQTALQQAQVVNLPALKTFTKCGNLLKKGATASQTETCMGTAPQDVVTAGQKFLAVLTGFDVGGDCASELGNLTNYVRGYISLVNGVQQGLQSGSTAAIKSQLANASTTLASARETQAPFEAACKPVA
jgi:hypothetical protein